ncbi:MAG TPA: GGDEF domain-containing protein [Dissulfurispiraceae bacterium]|nr:GGDEF domain-containing protein [Dissulfurispiraceae bacterium]
MSTKMVASLLSRDIKKMIAFNAIFMVLLIPLLMLAIKGSRDLGTVTTIAFWGFALSASNFFFVQLYLQRKTETNLQHSFESIQHQLSFDELTGAYNRRAGLVRLREELARARRTGTPFAIAMADIDRFKQINDTHGHLAGDKVIQHVAQSLKQQLRVCDIVIRFGGEEFLVVMLGTDEKKATQPLDRIRARLSTSPVKVNDARIPCSISIGVTTVNPDEPDIIEAISRADQALYCAKEFGRNRVVHKDQMMQMHSASAAHA